MTRPTVGDISLALFALPHAGYSSAVCAHIRRLLIAALGDRPLEAVAVSPSPAYAREIVGGVVDELATVAAQEVAA